MLCFTDVTKAETKAKIIKYPKIRRGNQLFQNASRNKGESGKTESRPAERGRETCKQRIPHVPAKRKNAAENSRKHRERSIGRVPIHFQRSVDAASRGRMLRLLCSKFGSSKAVFQSKIVRCALSLSW